jgi:hypothetical protein
MNAVAKSPGTQAALPIDALGGGAGGPLPVPTAWQNHGSYVSYAYGGAVVGTPTGGNEGLGTMNVQSGYYVNGQPITALFQPIGQNLVPIATAPPVNPNVGQLWWCDDGTTGGQMFIFYDDGSSQQWVVANNNEGVPDAPSNSVFYGRYNGTWSTRIDCGTY